MKYLGRVINQGLHLGSCFKAVIPLNSRKKVRTASLEPWVVIPDDAAVGQEDFDEAVAVELPSKWVEPLGLEFKDKHPLDKQILIMDYDSCAIESPGYHVGQLLVVHKGGELLNKRSDHCF